MYMKTVNKTTDDEIDLHLHNTNEVVDPKDVHLILPPSNFQKPVQVVAPTPKDPSKSSPSVRANPGAPVRPSRVNQDRRHSVEESPGSSRLNKQNSASQEPINIHVSVTINPALVNNNSTNSFHSPPGTLADLKRSRSQSRVSGGASSPTASSGSAQSETSQSSSSSNNNPARVNMNPASTSTSAGRHQQVSSCKSVSPSVGRRKFAAQSDEVVGPPDKSGCCRIV